MLLSVILERHRNKSLNECSRVVYSLFEPNDDTLTLSNWEFAGKLLELIPADGIALVGKSDIDIYGNTPNKENIESLISKIEQNFESRIIESDTIVVDSISTFFPDLTTNSISGVLVIPISSGSLTVILLIFENRRK